MKYSYRKDKSITALVQVVAKLFLNQMSAPFLLKYKEDQRTLGLLTLALVTTLFPYVLASHFSFHLGLYFLFFVVQTLMSYICGAINHNHTHCPSFRNRYLNILMNVLLSFAMGRSTTYLSIPHNHNHHGKFKTAQDWSDPRKIGNTRGIFGVFYYSIRIFFLMSFHQNQHITLKTHPRTMKRVYGEQVLLLLFFAILIHWNASIFFYSTFPGVIASIFGLLAINLFQHGLCDYQSPYDHSRNFVSPVYNWWLVNNGYHTYHHDHPRVHWSLLPELHRKWIDPFIRPDLNERSWFRFVFIEFLWIPKNRPIINDSLNPYEPHSPNH